MSLLQTRALRAFYGDFQALFDIDVTVDEGETVAIIGANGAGKTTFLRALPSLTVEENLKLGAHSGRAGTWTLERVYELFPMLAEHRGRPATLLSGGQQQMAAIGRALMSNPRLLLCDELSLGLAPVVIRDIYARLPAITREGTTLIIVEQDINRALDASARFYCFLEGRVALSAPCQGFDRGAITSAYFGV
jgi:branched-chain amino acid transport system ATP-binding protein